MTGIGKKRPFGGSALAAGASILVVVASLTLATPSSAYTPNDPVVTKMVDRGIEYLENVDDRQVWR